MRLAVDRDEGSVQVELGGLLEEGGVAGPLASGLPVRIHVVTELWRDRLVDALEGRSEWRGTVVLEPLGNRYRIEAGPPGNPDATQITATELPEVHRILQESLEVPLTPSRAGTFYYLVRVEVETLSASDLEELSRWLQGDLGPAVDEGGGVVDAVGRGLRRLFVRVLGLPVERYEVRSERFQYPPPPEEGR